MLILTLMSAAAIVTSSPVEPVGFDLSDSFAQAFDDEADRSAWELPEIDDQRWDDRDDSDAGAKLKMRALKLKLSVPI